MTVRPLALALVSLMAVTTGRLCADSPDDESILMEGAGITVSARQITPETGTVRVSREDIEKSSAPDIVTLLAETAGIAATSHGGYGTVSSLSVHGLTTSRIQVKLDGVLMNSPQSGDFDFNSIHKNSIESITIRYGGTAPATIEITTRKNPEKISWEAGFSNTAWIPPEQGESLADSQRLDFSVSAAPDPFTLHLDFFATRALNRFPYEYNGDTVIRTGNEMYDAGMSAKAAADISQLVSISLSGSLYYADKNVAGPLTTSADGTQEDFRSQERISVTAKQFVLPRISADFSLSHDSQQINWSDIETDSRHQLHSIQGSGSWRVYASEQADLRFRTTWHHSLLDSTNTGTVTRDTVDLEAGAEYRFSSGTTAGAECTVLASPDLDYPAFMPALSISKTFGKEHTAGVRVFRTFKMPDLNALYWNGDATAQGNPDLKNETAWGAVISYIRDPDTWYRVEHSLWGTWYTDAIVWQSAGGIWTPENVGEALYIGSDHKAHITPGNGFDITIQYAWLFTRALTGDFDFSDGKRMPYLSEHRFSVRLERTGRKSRWHLSPRYESSRYTTIMNVTELPGVFLLDGGVNAYVSSTVSLFFDGRNLLNEQWQSMEGYPMPSRSVTVGIRVKNR